MCASLHLEDTLYLNQVGVAYNRRGTKKQVKLAEREDVVWQAGKT
jgi:hypothetical protein